MLERIEIPILVENYKKYIVKKVLLVFAMGAFLFSCGDGSDEEKDKDKGPDLCDCVNATDEQNKDEDFKDACDEMEKEWEAEFKESSREDRAMMQEEIDDCYNASSEIPYGAKDKVTACSCMREAEDLMALMNQTPPDEVVRKLRAEMRALEEKSKDFKPEDARDCK